MAGRKPNVTLQDKFIEEYFANGGRTDVTAKKLGISLDTAYGWFKKPEFKERLKEKQEVWVEALRAAAVKRSLEKSDVLLIFLLKSMHPEIYDDNFRRTKWLTEKGLSDPDAPLPVRAVLVRGEEPERVRATRPPLADSEPPRDPEKVN